MPNKSFPVALVSGGGYVSGKEVISLELANGLRDAGYPVEMVITKWTNGQFPQQLRTLRHSYTQMRLGYISGTLALNEMRMTTHQLLYLPRLWLSYQRFLQRIAPAKIIHTNWHHLLLLIPFLRPNRDIFWIHEIIPNRARYRRLFSNLSRRLCCFVAVSEAVRRSVVALGVPPDHVTVIYNGLSEFMVTAQPRRRSEVRIGIVGQIGRWKGHDNLCLAFMRVATEYDTELHIFGADTGGYAQHLRSLISASNMEGKVHWHGFESDRSRIYSNIDICVVPSRFDEPFGLVAVEAGIARLPCIATKRGGLPEIIEDGITGLLVEPDDPEALGRALEILIENPALCSEMGAAAKRRVKHLFGRDRFVAEFAALLGNC